MKVQLLVGARRSGKTTTCQLLAETARRRGLRVGGIVSPPLYAGGRCVGYRVVDLASGRSEPLANETGPGLERAGRFHFTSAGLALGRAALETAALAAVDLVIVDEVGPLELAGGGWSQRLDRVAERPGCMVLSVRSSLAVRAAARWRVPRELIRDLASGSDKTIADVLKTVT